MQTVTTIGFDIAKSVFQVHGVDAVGQVVIRRQLKRRHVLAFFERLPPCLVGSRLAPRLTIGRASCITFPGVGPDARCLETAADRQSTIPFHRR